VRRLLWVVLVAGICISTASIATACRRVSRVIDGVALWNPERGIVVVTSKTLTYRGTLLGLLWGILKRTMGVPSPASTVSLESSVTQVHEGRTDTFRLEGGVHGLSVINGDIFGRTTDGVIVRFDLRRNTFAIADAAERGAYWQSSNPYADHSWSHDDRFLNGTAAATTIRLADGSYRISSSMVGSTKVYQLTGGSVASVIATIDETPSWCADR
jgi:hypothetical protein